MDAAIAAASAASTTEAAVGNGATAHSTGDAKPAKPAKRRPKNRTDEPSPPPLSQQMHMSSQMLEYMRLMASMMPFAVPSVSSNGVSMLPFSPPAPTLQLPQRVASPPAPSAAAAAASFAYRTGHQARTVPSPTPSNTPPATAGVASKIDLHSSIYSQALLWKPLQVGVFLESLRLRHLAATMMANRVDGARFVNLGMAEMYSVLGIRNQNDIDNLLNAIGILKSSTRPTVQQGSSAGGAGGANGAGADLTNPTNNNKRWRMLFNAFGQGVVIAAPSLGRSLTIGMASRQQTSLLPTLTAELTARTINIVNRVHYRIQLVDANTNEYIPLVAKEYKSLDRETSYTHTAAFLATYGQEYEISVWRSREMAELFPDELIYCSVNGSALTHGARFYSVSDGSYVHSFADIRTIHLSGTNRMFRMRFEPSQLRRTKNRDGVEETIREHSGDKLVGALCLEILRPSRMTDEQRRRYFGNPTVTTPRAAEPDSSSTSSPAEAASAEKAATTVPPAAATTVRFVRTALQMEQKPFKFGDATTGLGKEIFPRPRSTVSSSVPAASTSSEPRARAQPTPAPNVVPKFTFGLASLSSDEIKAVREAFPSTTQFGFFYDTIESLHARKLIVPGNTLYDATMDPDLHPPSVVVKREPGVDVAVKREPDVAAPRRVNNGLHFDVPTHVMCDLTDDKTTTWTETAIDPPVRDEVDIDGDSTME